MLAILEAPNKQSFVARLQDKLLDGYVKSIDRDGVVFVLRLTVAPLVRSERI
jgi:hypothetical protein